MADLVHLSDDLIFASRIAGVAHDLGLECVTARSSSDLATKIAADRPACVIVDLANPGFVSGDAITLLPTDRRPRVVAYGPHIDAAGLHAARAAGCDVVLPRSQFVADLAARLTVGTRRVSRRRPTGCAAIVSTLPVGREHHAILTVGYHRYVYV